MSTSFYILALTKNKKSLFKIIYKYIYIDCNSQNLTYFNLIKVNKDINVYLKSCFSKLLFIMLLTKSSDKNQLNIVFYKVQTSYIKFFY